MSLSNQSHPALFRRARDTSSKMAGSVDLELKKAFTELQAKVIDTQQKLKLADLQIEQLSRTKKHSQLTSIEIKSLPDATWMYEGVGRMFLLQTKESIESQLLNKQNVADEKITELEFMFLGKEGLSGTKCKEC
ncbi:prefoldin subunit 1 isoform 2-T2 [Mantella aurantiaca]